MRTVDRMPLAHATGVAPTSRVDPEVATNRQPQAGRPPSAVTAAPQLCIDEQLLKLMVTEGVALNSLVNDLRKEVVDLKLERGRLKASLAGQRHYLKEVQESHKQRLAAST